MRRRVAAIFDQTGQAAAAIADLRAAGVPDSQITLIAAEPDPGPAAPATAEEHTLDAGTGLAAGAGLGALLGLATAVVPVLGPFMAAGALGTSLAGVAASAAAGA